MTEDERTDELYLRLKGAREKLCRAQVLCADDTDRAALGKACDAIDYVGSQLPQWSKFDLPEPVPASREVRGAGS